MTLAIIIAIFAAIFLLFWMVAKLLPGEGGNHSDTIIPVNAAEDDDHAGHE